MIRSPSMTDSIKTKTKQNNAIYQSLSKANVNLKYLYEYNYFPITWIHCSKEWKNNEYHLRLVNELIDPQTNPKIYWPILKTLFNGRKIPGIILRKELTSLKNSFAFNVQQLILKINAPLNPLLSLMRDVRRLLLIIKIY